MPTLPDQNSPETARRFRGDAAFTLIELLVVIVIIGILSAVVIFSVTGINDKGQKSACKADKNTLKVAEEAFYANVETTPSHYSDEAGLVTGGFIEDKSDLYNITLVGTAPNYTDYTVVPVGTTCT
jgi:general secretion pathway protein G